MATDPIVKVISDLLAELVDPTPSGRMTTQSRLDSYAVAIVSVLAPLIRRQAFNEAAEAVEDYCEKNFASDDPDDPWPVAALVRGLGEKENQP